MFSPLRPTNVKQEGLGQFSLGGGLLDPGEAATGAASKTLSSILQNAESKTLLPPGWIRAGGLIG
jgi:hypothetical protein